MAQLNLIAGLLLAATAATSHAGLINERADVPATARLLDFEAPEIEGIIINGSPFLFADGKMSSNEQFTVGQYIANLGENGIWGAGNHFLSFDKIGSMTLDIDFNGRTSKGVAFDYSIDEEDPNGAAFLKVSYYDALNQLIEESTLSFTPFGSETYHQFKSSGYVSNTANIARIRIIGDGVVLDNLTYTQPVPEPASYALLLVAGLGLAGFVPRRRRKI